MKLANLCADILLAPYAMSHADMPAAPPQPAPEATTSHPIPPARTADGEYTGQCLRGLACIAERARRPVPDPAEHASVLIEITGSVEESIQIAASNIADGSMRPREIEYWRSVQKALLQRLNA